MSWKGTVLTDSGGFQVFSLETLRKVTEEGVAFRSHVDGAPISWTPESVMKVQEQLGADIAMPLDQCPALPSSKESVREATERSVRWLDRALRKRTREDQAVFGITQGGIDTSLRRWSAQETIQRECEGYAIGGLSVGEEKNAMMDMVEVSTEILPKEKPRYLMGVGTPLDLIEAVARGVDMFDCVMPTRNARNGTLFTSTGRVNIKNAEHRLSDEPLDLSIPHFASRDFSRGYLHHLQRSGEFLGMRLNSLHNLAFYVHWMKRIREAITDGTFNEMRKEANEIFPVSSFG
jgi:queuine tRNA-ribosyltransferase